MVRNHGIPKAFEVDATFAADRKIGQLVRVKPNGKITNVLGESNLLFFPLVEDVNIVDVLDANLKTKQAGVTVVGVAKVYVETASGITAGVEVGVGTTGIGCAIQGTGYKLGIALSTPKGDGDFIEVLLVPNSPSSTY